ncbi:hypothetical protein SS50377_24548 [Spironucleus salmonicida]|nr:hypothetical protein SS50377_24548 [Spironucleus salmonicida]
MPDLQVFGSEAYTNINTHYIKKEDTVLYEDVFLHLCDDPVENLLDITQMNFEYINPIQRDAFFRMPGRVKRQPTSHYGKLLVKSKPCLCKRFDMKILTRSLIMKVDQSFTDILEKFHYKMRSIMQTRHDLTLFQEEIVMQKNNFTQLNFKNIIQEQLCQTGHICTTHWENIIKKEFLSSNSAQQIINQIIDSFELKYKTSFNQLNDIIYINEDYQDLSSRLFLYYCDDQVVDLFHQQLIQLEKVVANLEDKYNKSINSLNGRGFKIQQLINKLNQLYNGNYEPSEIDVQLDLQ